ncbi:hypothetical protein PMIN01_11547 [Paraphaeosphaeria minitans]|uniref:Uncharacterized protein n=1 Tax=Paraphaeosphaeria minitans TaxID=565426 RepID=A0A9P6G8W6_9PLEO|nr:hypothetical protein PMIN01_11547 [Paraphaeosphaeria minitans]
MGSSESKRRIGRQVKAGQANARTGVPTLAEVALPEALIKPTVASRVEVLKGQEPAKHRGYQSSPLPALLITNVQFWHLDVAAEHRSAQDLDRHVRVSRTTHFVHAAACVQELSEPPTLAAKLFRIWVGDGASKHQSILLSTQCSGRGRA